MDWPRYFTHNRAHRMTIPWEMGIKVESRLRGPLARSLQRFQVGESGDGAHLKRVAAKTGDPAYIAAIELFVQEEQEHADLTARILHGLGAPLLKLHWSDKCFRILCFVSGLRLELMVILVAEIIAKRYFRVLYEATDDPVLRATCAQIRHDEEGHIVFHCDALRPAFSTFHGVLQSFTRYAWRLFFRVVCLVVLYDHRPLLRAVGVSPQQFRRDCDRIFDEVARLVFAPTLAVKATANE